MTIEPVPGTKTRRRAAPVAAADTPALAQAVPSARARKSRGPARVDPIEGLREQLLARLRIHYPGADLEAVNRAFDLAVEAHAGQTRASGEAYVIHPIASAQTVADLGIDPSRSRRPSSTTCPRTPSTA